VPSYAKLHAQSHTIDHVSMLESYIIMIELIELYLLR